MVRLRGGQVVGPDGVLERGTVVLDGPRIAAIGADRGPWPPAAGAGPDDIDCRGCWIVPGFIDIHIHGGHGVDVLDGGDAVARVAAHLPRYGVTGFLPTTVACPPAQLRAFLTAVETCRDARASAAARVLGAHLESNFINADYKGAQPEPCLRLPPRPGAPAGRDGEFGGAEILAVIAAHRAAVRIVTMAPELPGALDLVRHLAEAGHRVSLGHSAATYDEALAAITAGARHATHLFNRMPPLRHRAPGLAGAVLGAPEVTCEVVCDGHHVHPAMVRLAAQLKGRGGLVAITDGTAGAGLPVGATARLGEHTIVVRERCAELADGTLAGSVTTMDAVFRFLIGPVGLGVVEAAHLTATAPADALGRAELGRLVIGAAADLVVLDAAFHVRHTWVAGVLAWNSGGAPAVSPTGGPR